MCDCFILFEGERPIPKIEEYIHVLRNLLYRTKIMVIFPLEIIFFLNFGVFSSTYMGSKVPVLALCYLKESV
jgi:hypothetical protein